MSIWNAELTRSLVKLYKTHACLYNTRSSNYHNKSARADAMKQIQIQLCNKYDKEISVEMILKKINGIRTQYIEQMRNKMETGELKNPSWWLFSELYFLEPFVSPGAKALTAKIRPQMQEDNSESNPATSFLRQYIEHPTEIKSEEILLVENSDENNDLEEPCSLIASDYEFALSPQPKRRKGNNVDGDRNNVNEDYVDAALTYIGYELKSIKDPVRVRKIIRGFISQVHEAQDVL